MSKPSTSCFPFNADLTDNLLTTLPDFQSLENFVLSSKFVYDVFQYRSSSIFRAVARNQIGSALPQALRLMKCITGKLGLRPVEELFQEADFAPQYNVSPAEARMLADNASVVKALEDVFSWRGKDPRSKSNRLSDAESLRFQQSMYRFWLLSASYGPLAFENQSGDQESVRENIWSSIAKETLFLQSFGPLELIGIGEVHSFLHDVAQWATLVQPTAYTSKLRTPGCAYLLWGGPRMTLDAFLGRMPNFKAEDIQLPLWNALTGTFYQPDIASITGRWSPARGQSVRRRRSFILDDCFLQSIHCNQCLAEYSRTESMWSTYNWDYMILYTHPSRFIEDFLKREDKRTLDTVLSFADMYESTPYTQFVGEVFDLRSEVYKDWKREDWVCTQCMRGLLSDTINTWFRWRKDRKKIDGVVSYDGISVRLLPRLG
ncbi:hypothetical protein HYDPIDRAFT_111714 [Hydnomerulius pinastri MD-312]|uniref:Uncharacterized protein n=1 Tax=Hydnomerulius pinastri MD-312 TaxID=994086 RepID=A0A0C9W9H7_9AGAM|nr:hypothetical protein HYDPIDRAFT_111714 [Hydnomerulius pinastri MD-312]